MNHQEKKKIKVTFPLRGSIFWSLRILFLIVLLLTAVQLVLNVYSNEIMGSILKKYVEIKTNKLYKLDFAGCNLNFLRGELTFDKIYLLPDPFEFNIRQQKKNPTRFLVEAYFPSAKIKGSGLKAILLRKKLYFEDIQLKNPYFKYISYERKPLIDEKKIRIGSLFNLGLNNRLEELSVVHAVIKDGQLQVVMYHGDSIYQTLLNNINIEISNLTADSLLYYPIHKTLVIDNMELSIYDNEIELPNSPYVINIGNFNYSSLDRNLHLSEIGIGLRNSTIPENLLNQAVVLESIKMDELNVSDLDLQTIILKKEIIINKAIIKEPVAKILLTGEKPVQRNNALIKNLLKVFPKIKVNQINMISLDCIINEWTGSQRNRVLEVNDVTFHLDHLFIDTASYTIRKPKFFIDDFNINAGSQVFDIIKSLNSLSLRDIHISSVANSIQVTDLQFDHTSNSSNMSFSGKFFIPELKFTDLDIWRSIHDKKVNSGLIVINDLQAEIMVEKFNNEPDTTILEDSIQQNHISNYFTSIDIDNLHFNNIKFKLDWKNPENTHTIQIADLNSKFEKIHYDSAMLIDSLINSMYQQVNFDAKTITYFTGDSAYYVSCKELKSNQNLENIFANSVSLNQKNGTRVDLAELEIKGFSLTDLIYKKRIGCKEFLVREPKLQINELPVINSAKDSKDKPIDLPYVIDILQATVQDGEIVYINNNDSIPQGSIGSFSICLDEFWMDTVKLPGLTRKFKIHDFAVDVHDINMPIFNRSHKLFIKDFNFSLLDSAIAIKNVTIDPDINAPTEFNINAFSVNVNHVDLIEFLSSDNFVIPEIKFENPQISIRKIQNVIKAEENQNSENSSFSPFHNIWIHSLDVLNGSIEYVDQRPKHAMYLHTNKINSILHNIVLDEAFVIHPENYLLSNDLEFKCENLIYQPKGEGYTFKLDKLFISSFDSLLSAINLHLQPRKFGPNHASIEFITPVMSISGFNIFQLADTRSLIATHIRFDEPGIHYTGKDNQQNQNIFSSLARLSNINLGNMLTNISVGKLDLPGSKISFDVPDSANQMIIFPEQIDITLTNIDIDNTTTYPSPLDMAEDISINTNDIELSIFAPHYNLILHEISFSSSNRNLFLGNVELIPFTNKTEFSSHFEYQVNWMKLQNNNVTLSGIDLMEALNGNLVTEKIVMENANLEIYKDKNYPFDESNAPLLLVSALKKLPFTLIIDSIELWDCYIHYEEFAEGGHKPGNIIFEDLNSLILNITNDSVRIEQSARCKLTAQSKLMGTGKIDVEIELSLSGEDDYQRIQGRLNEMDLRQMNNFMENVAFASIKEGHNKELTFSFELNNDLSEGNMKFLYNDLKVNFIDKKSSKTGVDEAMGAFVANTFILKKDNPRYIIPRKGDIYFYRDKKRSVINYWVKSLLSGVKSSVGLKVNRKKLDKRSLIGSGNASKF